MNRSHDSYDAHDSHRAWHAHTLPVPARGPACAAYAPRLPLLAQRLLPSDEADSLRRHAATCAHCQALLAAYDRLDAALVQRFAAPQDDAVHLTEEIMEHIEEQHNPFPPAAETFATPMQTPPPLPSARRRLSLLAAVAAVLAISVVAAALLAARGLRPDGLLSGIPRPTPSPVLTTPALHGVFALTQITMLSPNDGWALGVYSTAACSQPPAPELTPGVAPNLPGCRQEQVELHFDGHGWMWSPVPALEGTLPAILSSPPGGQTWAVSGEVSKAHDPIPLLRYVNGQWQASGYMTPPPSADGPYPPFEHFAMVSPSEGWAVGTAYGDVAYLAHLRQGTWTVETIPGSAQMTSLQAISMVSPSDGWAVGVTHADPQMTVILHDHDGTWTREDPGIPGSLNAVYAVSPTEAWADGSANPSTGPGLILHYHNGTWTAVTGLRTNILHDITMVSPAEGWAVGDGAMFLHYRNGQWSNAGIVIHQYQLDQVAMSSPTEGWAVGGGFGPEQNPNGPEQPDGPALFHYDGTRWTPYSLAAVEAQLTRG